MSSGKRSGSGILNGKRSGRGSGILNGDQEEEDDGEADEEAGRLVSEAFAMSGFVSLGLQALPGLPGVASRLGLPCGHPL